MASVINKIKSEISVFIKCLPPLRIVYEQSDLKQKKSIATFFKTFLFYNSTLKSVFWTGLATSKRARKKEHWYSTLTTAVQLLEKSHDALDFDEKSDADKIFWIYRRMQWNYATKSQNGALKKQQGIDLFFSTHNGDPKSPYDFLRIPLNIVDASPRSNALLALERERKSFLAEIEFVDKKVLTANRARMIRQSIGKFCKRHKKIETYGNDQNQYRSSNLLVVSKSLKLLVIALQESIRESVDSMEWEVFERFCIAHQINHTRRSDRLPYLNRMEDFFGIKIHLFDSSLNSISM